MRYHRPMIVTVTGANDYARRRELDSIIEAFMAEYGDLAIERLDGEEASSDRMTGAMQSLPLLSSRKLVVLREPSKQKAFAETINDTLKAVAETIDVVLYEPKLDKRSSYYKILKKATDYREFGELDGVGLARWAMTYAAEQGGALNMADAQLLLARIGPSQQVLKSELDKLLAYDAAISRKSIELLVEPTPMSTIFELLDAAFAGNATRAFALYREQRALRVEPQAIIALLSWQLHILATVKAGEKQGAEYIAKETKINPFVVRKTLSVARRLTLFQIKKLIADLLHLDMQMKRSAIDADEALQLYVLSMT